jgi:hypothetical protein
MKPVYILYLYSLLLISGLNVAGSVYTVAGLNKLRPRLKNVKLARATQQETLTTCFLCQVGAEFVRGRCVEGRYFEGRCVEGRYVEGRCVEGRCVEGLNNVRWTLDCCRYYFRIRILFTWIRIQHFRLNTDPNPGFWF